MQHHPVLAFALMFSLGAISHCTTQTVEVKEPARATQKIHIHVMDHQTGMNIENPIISLKRGTILTEVPTNKYGEVIDSLDIMDGDTLTVSSLNPSRKAISIALTKISTLSYLGFQLRDNPNLPITISGRIAGRNGSNYPKFTIKSLDITTNTTQTLSNGRYLLTLTESAILPYNIQYGNAIFSLSNSGGGPMTIDVAFDDTTKTWGDESGKDPKNK